MQSKVIKAIYEELEQFEMTNDQKHIYATEKLLSLLKEENPHTSVEKDAPKGQENKNKKSLDGLYLAEEKSNSIFDF